MGVIKILHLSEQERKSLEIGYRLGGSHCFRTRCRVFLLKSKAVSSKEIGLLTEMTYVSVNHWLKRYAQAGILGLYTKPGRGRKSIINVSDEEAVLLAIKNDRQNLQAAKAEWESSSGKSASRETFRRFLKRLADDISV